MGDILIFTDGAAKGNPGPGGWGAIVADEREVEELGGRADHTTNNRMELQAVLEALTYAQKYSKEEIVVHADSEYVIKGATLWGDNWRRQGWLTKQKKPVLNQDLWEPLLALVDSYEGRLQWKNVGGHVGVIGNERADAIASTYALDEHIDLYSGSRSGYGIDIANISHDEEKLKERTKSRNHSRQAAYSYISAVDGKVEVHKTWKECEQRVRGKKARFKKALSASEEAEIIRRFSVSI